MNSRGRRYEFNEEPRLNFKKVFAVIIAIAVIAMIIFVIVKLVSKGKENGGKITSVSYYTSFKDDKWGVINSKGENVIEPSYQELIVIPNAKRDVFLCTYSVNYEDGSYKTKALNSKNQEILSGYEQIEPVTNQDDNGNVWYEDDIIRVKKDGKYGLIDLDGKELLPAEYEEITVMHSIEHGLKVKKDGRCGIVNYSNQEILPIKYDEVEDVYGSELYVVTDVGDKKVVKADGTEVLATGFDNISSISEMQAEDSGMVFEKGGKYGFMDLAGTVKMEPVYDKLTEASNNNFVAKKDETYGIIGVDGTEKIPFGADTISYDKSADLYIIENAEFNARILNNQLEEKISGILIDIDTNKNYIKMRVGDEYKYYNFQFEEKKQSDFLNSNTLFLSKQNDKYGFVDKDGKVVVDYKYEDATEQNEQGFAAVKQDGKWGSIDSKGATVIEPCYNLDEYLEVDFIGKWHKGIDLNMNYYSQED